MTGSRATIDAAYEAINRVLKWYPGKAEGDTYEAAVWAVAQFRNAARRDLGAERLRPTKLGKVVRRVLGR